jgi:hypothetical protein
MFIENSDNTLYDKIHYKWLSGGELHKIRSELSHKFIYDGKKSAMIEDEFDREKRRKIEEA